MGVPGSPGGRGKENPMRVQVERVVIPFGSTIGFGFGRTDDGTVHVAFVGDARRMYGLGEEISEADEPVVVEVPEGAIVGMAMELPPGS